MTRQLLTRLAVTALLLAGAWAALDLTGRPAAAAPDRSAAEAVSALVLDTGEDAARRLPSDFATAERYRPRVVDGILLDPHGGCSSPVPLPADFTPACQRHDLGYDLLRVAARDGGTLPASARRAVDEQLDAALHQVCTTRTGLSRAGCNGWASVAATAVRINSVRQHWSVPGHESPRTVTTGVAAVAALLTGAAALVVALRLAASALVRSVRRSAPATRQEVLS